MTSKYIVRFDDICPTMNWHVWDNVEKILDKFEIKPIVAIVPNNMDPKLKVDSPLQIFWERVSEWERKGWCIAIHGFNHVYVTEDSGIVGLNPRSEFASLDYKSQYEKIEEGLSIFAKNNITPSAWVAPAHSFDFITLKILRKFGVRIISDGYFLKPGIWHGLFWIPQQIWNFRKMPFGVWTVCLHINNFTDRDLQKFSDDLNSFKGSITSVTDLLKSYSYREISLLDHLAWKFWQFALICKLAIKRI
jgi:hypothetical protein